MKDRISRKFPLNRVELYGWLYMSLQSVFVALNVPYKHNIGDELPLYFLHVYICVANRDEVTIWFV